MNSSDARKQARIDEVAALLDAFSKVHLTPELTGYVRKLWEQIGRKRNYVITGGAKEVWASAVVYVIARLNFLFDSKSPTSLSADIICAFFETKKTTVMAHRGHREGLPDTHGAGRLVQSGHRRCAYVCQTSQRNGYSKEDGERSGFALSESDNLAL